MRYTKSYTNPHTEVLRLRDIHSDILTHTHNNKLIHFLFFIMNDSPNVSTLAVPSYIKEFVHGDFGRTKPNLCDLLKTETDILELDVDVGI